MSGTTIILEKNAFAAGTQRNGKLPAVSDGCTGYWEFGADLARSLRNLVNPGLPALAVGAITSDALGVSLTGMNGCINTRQYQTADATVMVVMRTTQNVGANPLRAMAISNFSTRGISLYLDALTPAAPPGGQVRAGGWFLNSDAIPAADTFYQVSVTSNAMPVTDVQAWRCLSFVVKSGVPGTPGVIRARDLTAGLTLTRAMNYGAVLDTNPYRLGGAWVAGWECTQRQLRAGTYSRALSTAEEDAQYSSWKAQLAAISVAI